MSQVIDAADGAALVVCSAVADEDGGYDAALWVVAVEGWCLDQLVDAGIVGSTVGGLLLMLLIGGLLKRDGGGFMVGYYGMSSVVDARGALQLQNRVIQ